MSIVQRTQITLMAKNTGNFLVRKMREQSVNVIKFKIELIRYNR